MRVSRRILIAISIFSVSYPSLYASTPQTPAQLLTQARERIAAGSHEEAIQMLESALETASEQDCKAIVDQLRKSYQTAIHQSRQAGRHDLADHYTQNLKLIDSVTHSEAPASDSQGGKLPEPPPPVDPPNDLPSITIPKATGKSDLTEPKALDETAPAAPIVSQPRDRTGSESSIESEPTPASSANGNEPATKVNQFDIAEADDAFRARKYSEAGNTYQQLLDNGSLPDSRRGHLAYCRAAALVDRINKSPSDPAEWNAIRQEIESIQNVQPDFWFAEYLGDLVRERMNRSNGSVAKSSEEVASAGIMQRTADQIRSMNPLRKITR